MDFKEMMHKDLADSFSLGEFGVEAVHYFASENETLNVLFDKTTEVLLDKGEAEGVEATVPSLIVPTSKAVNISYQSLFLIDGTTYGVIEKPHQKDGTTVVYLDVQDA